MKLLETRTLFHNTSHPQPYCSLNYITTRSINIPTDARHGRSAGPVLTHYHRCWPSAGPVLCLMSRPCWHVFQVTSVIHFSPLSWRTVDLCLCTL